MTQPGGPAEWAIVILAGGDGRRIGGRKPACLLAGRTLLDRALDMAKEWSPIVAISVRERGQIDMPANVTILEDHLDEGPISGCAAALQFAGAQNLRGVLTIPCDTPLLPKDLLDRLAAALVDQAGAASAASAGRLHPSCTLWRSSGATAMTDYLAAGGSSLKGLAAHVGATTVEWPAQPFDPFFNINDSDDLVVAERLIRSRSSRQAPAPRSLRNRIADG